MLVAKALTKNMVLLKIARNFCVMYFEKSSSHTIGSADIVDKLLNLDTRVRALDGLAQRRRKPRPLVERQRHRDRDNDLFIIPDKLFLQLHAELNRKPSDR